MKKITTDFCKQTTVFVNEQWTIYFYNFHEENYSNILKKKKSTTL